MINSYDYLYKKCETKYKDISGESDIETIFEKDLQKLDHIKDDRDKMDEVFLNFVKHSQNRSEGCALDFFESGDENNICNKVSDIIVTYHRNHINNFDYLELFSILKEERLISSLFKEIKGKDIQYIQLAKTCQDIHNYLKNYNSLSEFINAPRHIFEQYNPNENWHKIKNISKDIYNMGNALVSDFFKEQFDIIGREFLIKFDTHIRRFFEIVDLKDIEDGKKCKGNKKSSIKNVYCRLINLYNRLNKEDSKKMTPYNLDKLIFKIGKLLNKNEFIAWAESINVQDSKS